MPWNQGLALEIMRKSLIPKIRVGEGGPLGFPKSGNYSFAFLSLNALLITLTELKLIAAAARIRLNGNPNVG